MRKNFTRLGLISPVLALVISGSTVLALPAQANAHAQAANTGAANAGSSGAANSHASAATGQANGQTHLAEAQLKSCQNRENAVNNIISRINTRAQNQLTLFNTIATRVETFYTTKGKTVSNYDQLVSAINGAKDQAQTDLSTMQSSATFSCTGNDPKGMVTAFQGYLKTEITDLQNYRSAVKNLIVAVAQANGVSVSDSSQSSAQGGQQ